MPLYNSGSLTPTVWSLDFGVDWIKLYHCCLLYYLGQGPHSCNGSVSASIKWRWYYKDIIEWLCASSGELCARCSQQCVVLLIRLSCPCCYYRLILQAGKLRILACSNALVVAMKQMSQENCLGHWTISLNIRPYFINSHWVLEKGSQARREP